MSKEQLAWALLIIGTGFAIADVCFLLYVGQEASFSEKIIGTAIAVLSGLFFVSAILVGWWALKK